MAALFVVEPGCNSIFGKPECYATAIGESFVILRPVTDAVLLLFLLFHRLRITVSPHPLLFMQQRPAFLKISFFKQ